MEAFFFFLFRPAYGNTIPTSICTAFANAGRIVSLYAVGYQEIEVVEGYSLFTVTFEDVAGGNLDIQQWRVLVDDGEGGKVELGTTGEVTLEGMIADGGGYDAKQTYNWRTRSGKTGWHNSSRYCEKGTQYEVSLNPAQGWCVNNKTGGKVYFRISGGVSLTPASNRIGPGYGIYGNMSPVTIDIQDMRVLQDDGKGGKMEPTTTGLITLEGMIADGGGYDAKQTYNWRTRSGNTGWHNSSRYCEKGTQYEVSLKPGQAFCLNNKTEGDIWLEFKSPIAPATAE